ncbi:MAG TPA: penicillin-binding protein 1C [Vicinamibacterales bacterium]|jgi:penicillin-binding protein 1C|nr:penicillin-binding protein 1C [Vicinamibacterales bacterium]
MIRSRRFVIAVVAASMLAGAAWIRLGPIPADLLTGPADRSTVVLDRHGSALYEARSSAGTRSSRLEASALPPVLVNATIAAEDRRFFRHPGVDPLAFTRAFVRNLRAGSVVEGGSTITQQSAKILLDRRSPRRRSRGLLSKFQEAVLAMRLEHRLTKKEILALYLNIAPYGNQVVGAGRASEVYFGVQPSLLTIAQAAFLAALPQRPSAYNPYNDPRPALRRQRRVIDALVHQKHITPDEAHTARSERLQIEPAARAFAAPHFVEMVLAAHGGGRSPRLLTTLDAQLQSTVVDIVRAQREALLRHGAHNVAVVVLDNERSEWLAWEGSGDYFDKDHGGAINGGAALRQPGSALKPFVYALGFETGETPATVLPDVPSTYPTAEPGVVYTPRNYDGTFHGPLRARQALAGSQNVPAVALASRTGVPDLLRLLRSAGFTGFDKTASHYGLGVALGNAEVTLADLVGAYAVFARGGIWRQPHAIVEEASETRRVMSPRASFWVTDILSDDEARAYVFGRGGSLEFPFSVAVKTGTSQAYRDNWTVGYTREVTVGVWVGNFDRRPLIGSTGVTGAAPIFHAVMLAAQRHVHGREESHLDLAARPADLREQTVCSLSGMRAGDACPIRRTEWLPPGFSPLPCSWHHASEDGLLTMWPDEYRTWAAGRGLLEPDHGTAAAADSSPRAARRDAAAASMRALEVVSPPDGATYLIDPTLRSEFQALPLRARGTTGQLEWTINGRRLRQAPGQSVSWPLERGTHVFRARDARGRVAEASILVK